METWESPRTRQPNLQGNPHSPAAPSSTLDIDVTVLENRKEAFFAGALSNMTSSLAWRRDLGLKG